MYSTASLFGRRLNNGYRDLLTQLKGYLTEEQLSGVEAAYRTMWRRYCATPR